jgi:hypothetical protein
VTTAAVVLEAERARCAAMLAGDVAGLGDLLSDRLTFIHSNGAADDKRILLEKMGAGSIRYHAIDWTDPVVELQGGLAALHGVMTLKVTVGGTDKTLHNRAVLLWEAAGADWRLSYFQSTPILGG